ncbi:MAG: DNA-directed RNA polymerase subunit alpha C-terminal domain-containing protein [Lachnospiraceae bacterium]
MYLEIESYLKQILEKLQSGEISRKEQDESLNLLENLFQVGLLTPLEYQEWTGKILGIAIIPIGDMELSARAKSCLHKTNITNSIQLRKLILQESDIEFWMIRNLGVTIGDEIVKAALALGIVQKEELGKNATTRIEKNEWYKCIKRLNDG